MSLLDITVKLLRILHSLSLIFVLVTFSEFTIECFRIGTIIDILWGVTTIVIIIVYCFILTPILNRFYRFSQWDFD